MYKKYMNSLFWIQNINYSLWRCFWLIVFFSIIKSFCFLKEFWFKKFSSTYLYKLQYMFCWMMSTVLMRLCAIVQDGSGVWSYVILKYKIQIVYGQPLSKRKCFNNLYSCYSTIEKKFTHNLKWFFIQNCQVYFNCSFSESELV